MIIHDVVQGGDQWHALRREHFTASEAPAMMGACKHMSRDELLKMKALPVEKEIATYLQKIYDKGHAVETAIRPVIETFIGQDLYPVTASETIDGLPLLASSDGMTIEYDDGFECKQWNAETAAAVLAGDIPDYHVWQLEHQCAVFGIKSILFVVTDGTEDRTLKLRYESMPTRRKKLIAGWKQFKADLDAYQHVETPPAPVANAIMELPALNIQLVGEVKSSNLATFRDTALAFIKNIKTDLQDDQDFANAESMVKFCEKAEKDLEVAKKVALSQTASIDELFRTVDLIREEMRQKRLELDKLVKMRKESIRLEIQNKAKTALSAHVALLNNRLGKPYMPQIPADFAGAMKGKKTIASLHSGVNDELARAKIAASEIADKIEINLKSLNDLAGSYAFLFNDAATILQKENDDFVALIKIRIADHKEREAKRLEAERERIRTEEQAKAERAAKAKLAEEMANAARQADVNREPVAKQTTSIVDTDKVTATARPTYADMITVLCRHYKVPPGTVVDWLSQDYSESYKRVYG